MTTADEYQGEERRKVNGDLAKLVGEAGVKLASLEDARTEMKSVRESVLVLADAIGRTSTAEEAAATARKSRQYLVAGVLSAILFIVVIGWRLNENQRVIRQGIQCNVLQNFEHRTVNQLSHDEVFNKFRLPIPPHRPLPAEPSEAQIVKACAPFYPKGYVP